jgi:hypothetical protein
MVSSLWIFAIMASLSSDLAAVKEAFQFELVYRDGVRMIVLIAS